jgi:hypothetical protein
MTEEDEMTEEYESLREEIKSWQDRRFTLLQGVAALVAAVLALEVAKSPSSDHWPLISSMLLAILSCANGLTWYCGLASSKIGSYLQAFYEEPTSKGNIPRWESSLLELKSQALDKFHVNQWFGAIYLVLGLISVGIPYIASKSQSVECFALGFVLSTAAFFVASLILVICFSYPREKYLVQWREIRNKRKELQ